MDNRPGISFRKTYAAILISVLIVLILFFSVLSSYIRLVVAPSSPAANPTLSLPATGQPSSANLAPIPALSSDQRQALIQSLSRNIQIRTNPDNNSQPFTFVLELQTGVPVRTVAVNQDESLLAAGLENGLIVIWSLSNLSTNGQISVQILAEHVGPVSSLAFDTQNGRRLASASADTTIKLWDVDAGRAITTLSGHQDRVSAIAFVPNNPILASGSADATVKLWDINSGQELATMQGHVGPVLSLAIEPSAARMVSGGEDNQIILWDLTTQRSVVNLAGHTDWISGMAYLPTGAQVTSVSYDRTARVWTLNPPQAVQLLLDPPPSGALTGIAAHPSGRLLAIASNSNSIYLWNMATATQLPLPDQTLTAITSIHFSPQGTFLAAGSVTGTIRLWRTRAELIN